MRTEVFVAGRGGGKTTHLVREVLKALMLEEVVAVVVPNQVCANEWRSLLRERGIPVRQHSSSVPMGLTPRTLHIITPGASFDGRGLAPFPTVFVDNVDLIKGGIEAVEHLSPKLVTLTDPTLPPPSMRVYGGPTMTQTRRGT